MGYTTEFNGRINLSRELNRSETKAIDDFADERHDPSTLPGYNCDWVVTNDGLGIHWNGTEKFYDADAWMQFITPNGIVANGVIDAQGEDPGDRWRLKVADNKVSTVKARVTWEDE
jgi:hypothetical protein